MKLMATMYRPRAGSEARLSPRTPPSRRYSHLPLLPSPPFGTQQQPQTTTCDVCYGTLLCVIEADFQSNGISEGDIHDTYYVHRRTLWPPTFDRKSGEKYEEGAMVCE